MRPKDALQVTLTQFPLVMEELQSLFDQVGDSFLDRFRRTRAFSQNIRRTRRTVRSIFDEYGEYYMRRAYRMDERAFWTLHSMIEEHLQTSVRSAAGGTPNGIIRSELKLSIALRYLAGGDPLDIMISHGVSHSSVFESLWQVVDAINMCEALKISFPLLVPI